MSNHILTPKMIAREALRQMANGLLPRPLARAIIPVILRRLSMPSFGEVLTVMAEPARPVEVMNEIANDQVTEEYGDYRCYVGFGETEIFVAVGDGSMSKGKVVLKEQKDG